MDIAGCGDLFFKSGFQPFHSNSHADTVPESEAVGDCFCGRVNLNGYAVDTMFFDSFTVGTPEKRKIRSGG